MIPKNIQPHRSLNILFIGDTYERYYTYHYYKFFKKMGHKVLTVCRSGDIKINQDVDYKKEIQPELKKHGFKPDLIVVGESPPFYWINSNSLPKSQSIPTALLCFDTALRYRDHAIRGSNYDHVFISQQDYLEYFYKNCKAKTHLLLYACDPEVHCPIKATEVNDIGFAGTAWQYPPLYKKRIEYLQKLKKFCKIEIGEGYWGEDAAKLFARSKMIFNLSMGNGVNPRIFEALSYGKLLLTNRTEGLNGIFRDNIHLAFYNDFSNLKYLIRYYLDHPDLRNKIAAQGHYKAWLKHTFYHRVDTLLRKIFGNSIYKS